MERWEKKKAHLKQCLINQEPEDYKDLFKKVIKEVLARDTDYVDVTMDYADPDEERITVIDHGYYNGTIVFVVAETGCQPEMHWVLKMSYGSCGLCDTFKSVYECTDFNKRINGYMKLALHMIQGLKEC